MPQEITKTVYEYDELSEAAKEKAYQDWYDFAIGGGYAWDAEMKASIAAFEQETHCNVFYWTFDETFWDFKIAVDYWRSNEPYGIYDEVIAEVIDQDDYEEEFGRDMVEYYDLTPEDKGKVNEGVKQAFAELIEKSKSISENYGATGVFTDEIFDGIAKASPNDDPKEVFYKSVDNFLKMISEDFAYQNSEEYFIENDSNFHKYYEDGSIYE